MINKLHRAMIDLYRGDAKRIQHFCKVHSYAKLIAETENMDRKSLFILEAAALTHDIAIHLCEEKYGNCNGKLQEKEGPAMAEKMLRELGFDADVSERVQYLIAHHHTYDNMEGIDYQILVEADFLVNILEDDLSKEAAFNIYRTIFKTECGKKICEEMFGLYVFKESDLQDENKEKALLRKRILKERNALSEEQRRIWDRQIFEKLVEYDKEKPCSAYLCYVNYKSEVETKDFICWCLNNKKTVFVPKVLEKESAEMEFYRIDAWEELKCGYQGIWEPEALPERAFPEWFAKKPERKHLRMLLPGAVFDDKRNRIGYGGGFYDRWLAKREDDCRDFDGKLEKIGLAYAMQLVKALPADSFDRKVDFVMTEKSMI